MRTVRIELVAIGILISGFQLTQPQLNTGYLFLGSMSLLFIEFRPNIYFICICLGLSELSEYTPLRLKYSLSKKYIEYI